MYNSSGHLVAAKIHLSTWRTKSDLGKVAKSRQLFEFAFENLDSATNEYENDLLKVLPKLNKKFKKVKMKRSESESYPSRNEVKRNHFNTSYNGKSVLTSFQLLTKEIASCPLDPNGTIFKLDHCAIGPCQ